MIQTPYRGRFAPSPTGPLHFGSLVAACASWIHARQCGGTWLIRVEDLDPPREIAGAADLQLRTLQAFGLESDESVWRQSERATHYARALQTLFDAGHAFECRCSRSDLAPERGIHRRCIQSDPQRAPAIRARVPALAIEFQDALQGPYRQPLDEQVGDFVLRRVDGLHAYQLAVVVDDAAQAITHVVRGADLLDSTPRQIWLQRLLGLASPHYAHLPLVLDLEGRKLSKSLAALPVAVSDPIPLLRAAWGFLGQDERILRAATTTDQALSLAQRDFDWSRVPRANSAPAVTHGV
jgi:glutamyl-Q tRNA(Asp) synthetase